MSDITTDAAAWQQARVTLLEKEKAHLRAGDAIAAERRALPKLLVSTPYTFDTASGAQTLDELFAGRGQLITQHFMFGPDWDAGCPSCSFWADGYDNMIQHMNQRDVSFVAVSRGPLDKLLAYRERMGWSFEWVSSGGCSFSHDFGVSATEEERAAGRMTYNYRESSVRDGEFHGLSVFERGDDDSILHTYSSYGRGLDPMNTTYAYLDLTPRGRQEDELPFSMAWVRRHDEYE